MSIRNNIHIELAKVWKIPISMINSHTCANLIFDLLLKDFLFYTHYNFSHFLFSIVSIFLYALPMTTITMTFSLYSGMDVLIPDAATIIDNNCADTYQLQLNATQINSIRGRSRCFDTSISCINR